MIEELVFTSAPRGLQVGKSGFCTVASTPGMSAPVARLLESLSGYRHLSPPGSPEASLNPVVYSHLRTKVGGRRYHIVSRVGDAGFDYSNRSNKIAHHLAIQTPADLSCGPAAILASDDLMFAQWEREPAKLQPRQLSVPQSPAHPCQLWQQFVGDAGWAGDVLHAVEQRKTVYMIVTPELPALALIQEAVSLLVLEQQWQVTFSTFFTKLPPNVVCDIRCIMSGSPEVSVARRSDTNFVIDLTAVTGFASSEYAQLAREGVPIGTPSRPASSPHDFSESEDVALPSTGSMAGESDDGLELLPPDLQPSRRPSFRQMPPGNAGHGGRKSLMAWGGALVILAIIGGLGGWWLASIGKSGAPAETEIAANAVELSVESDAEPDEVKQSPETGNSSPRDEDVEAVGESMNAFVSEHAMPPKATRKQEEPPARDASGTGQEPTDGSKTGKEEAAKHEPRKKTVPPHDPMMKAEFFRIPFLEQLGTSDEAIPVFAVKKMGLKDLENQDLRLNAEPKSRLEINQTEAGWEVHLPYAPGEFEADTKLGIFKFREEPGGAICSFEKQKLNTSIAKEAQVTAFAEMSRSGLYIGSQGEIVIPLANTKPKVWRLSKKQTQERTLLKRNEFPSSENKDQEFSVAVRPPNGKKKNYGQLEITNNELKFKFETFPAQDDEVSQALKSIDLPVSVNLVVKPKNGDEIPENGIRYLWEFEGSEEIKTLEKLENALDAAARSFGEEIANLKLKQNELSKENSGNSPGEKEPQRKLLEKKKKAVVDCKKKLTADINGMMIPLEVTTASGKLYVGGYFDIGDYSKDEVEKEFITLRLPVERQQ